MAFAAWFLALTHAPGPVFVAPFIALVAVIARSRPAVWLAGAAAGAAILGVAHTISGGSPAVDAVFASVWFAASLAVAFGIRARRRFATEMRARAQLMQRSREEGAKRRLAEERLRIAREMHDVVGHSLAVISLQAGVAEHLLDTRPEEARRAVTAIRTVSKQALGDLRVELALLRGNGAPVAERAPAPKLAELRPLVTQMRDAGLHVDLDMPPDGEPVPDVIAAAAFRIVQESLTNVARHAGAQARAEVRVSRDDSTLTVEVLDDGPGAASTDGDGIAGMHDRAAALGGELVAGNRPGRGFRVRATLPLGAR